MGKRPHRAAARAARPTGLKHQDHRGRTCIWRATTIRPSGRHPAHRHAKVDLIIPFTHPAMMTRYGWGAVLAQA